jgi:transcription elongation factor GreA
MSTNKPVWLTEEGRAKLEEELEYLRTVRRPDVAAKIHAAKEEGDITENAGYDEAKRDQAFVEGRIMTLESMLKDAAIIQAGGPADMVRLGTKVTVVEDGSSSPESYQIVGSAEVDVSRGWISNESPLGKALLGRTVGESVSVQTPGGTLRFRIVSIV